MTTKGTPYDAARIVLRVFHQIYAASGHRRWSVTPDAEKLAREGVSEDMARKALRIMVAQGLAEPAGSAAFVITEYGAKVFGDAALLDEELPATKPKAAAPAAASPAAAEPAKREPDAGARDERAPSGVVGLISEEALAAQVERDLAELRVAQAHGIAKSATWLALGLIDALLVDVLARNRALAAARSGRPDFPEGMDLGALAKLAADAALLQAPRRLIDESTASAIAALPRAADVASPRALAKSTARADESTARAAGEALEQVVKDLEAARARGDLDAYTSATE